MAISADSGYKDSSWAQGCWSQHTTFKRDPPASPPTPPPKFDWGPRPDPPDKPVVTNTDNAPTPMSVEYTHEKTRERAFFLLAKAEKIEAMRDTSRSIQAERQNAERQERQKAERQKAEADLLAKAASARREKEESDRLEKEESDRLEKEEAERLEKEEAERLEKEEAERQKAQAVWLEKEELDRLENQEAAQPSTEDTAIPQSYQSRLVAAQAIVSKKPAQKFTKKGERDARARFLPAESMARHRQPKRRIGDEEPRTGDEEPGIEDEGAPTALVVYADPTSTSTALVVPQEEPEEDLQPSPAKRLKSPTKAESEDDGL
jgi:hypothetical protein